MSKLVDFALDSLGGTPRHWSDIPAPEHDPVQAREYHEYKLSRPREEARYSFKVCTEGSYIALKASGMPARGGGKRNDVKGFSQNSRSRLFQRLAQLRQDDKTIPLFVTLTYSEDYPSDFREHKYHLKKFAERLKYAFPDSGFIWKLEYQKRGAPHYHLLLFGVGVSHAMDFIPSAWVSSCGTNDEVHLAWHMGELGNAHCVQPVKSWRGAMAYAGKYIGKVDTDNPDLPTGRIWGTRGCLPESEEREVAGLTYRQALQIKRIVERVSGRKRKGEKAYQIGFWTFSNGVDYWGVAGKVLEHLERLLPENNPPPLFERGWYFQTASPLDDELQEVDFF